MYLSVVLVLIIIWYHCSVNIVGIKKSSTTTPATPTVVYSTNTYPPSPTAKRKKKPLLNIKEIVTSDLATTSHQRYHQYTKLIIVFIVYPVYNVISTCAKAGVHDKR